MVGNGWKKGDPLEKDVYYFCGLKIKKRLCDMIAMRLAGSFTFSWKTPLIGTDSCSF